MDAQQRLARALADSYAIKRQLGRGGMATVYLARDVKHDRPVAIKVLRPELAAGLGAERFVREIEISAKLTHPRILPLFDSGEADGLLYYVMPYVEGESLGDRLEREGKLPVDEALRLTDQISSALTYAHEQGVVHRDIKPANILITGDQAVIADFGIARALEAASTEGLTMTGMAVGTPAYMSPEQAAGERDVDARTDVYALGCVVYEMLSGALPAEWTGPRAVVAKQAADAAPNLRTTDPEIPVYLDRAVSKAMATDPGQRFDTAAAFTDALTTGTIVPKVRTRGARRTGRRAGLVAAAVAILLLAAWWITGMTGSGQRMERLAVLPLADLTDDPDQEHLVAGVHEALIAELGRLDLSVTSRRTMARYRDTEKGIAEIAEELGVDGVIQGSVFRGGDSLEIATRLYDRSEQEVWSASFDGVMSNIVALYRGFARAIADQIRLSLRPEDETHLDEAAPVNPDVYEAYLRGMHVLNNRRRRADADIAIEHFNRAVEQNPADPLAHAGLALAYTTLGHGLDSRPEEWPRARSAAERAIRLDSTVAEAWSALAKYRTYYERDWEGAEQAFRRANELNPSLSINHYHYSWYLVLFGRVEEAIAEHRRAQELDPLTPLNTVWIPALYWWEPDYERALREARTLTEQYPNNWAIWHVVAESAAKLGRWDEAFSAVERSVEVYPLWQPYPAFVYARAGRTEEAVQMVRELEAGSITPFTAGVLAITHAALGNRDEALRWLDYENLHGWAAWWVASQFSELWEPYKTDPAYQEILRRRYNLRYGPDDPYPVALPVVAPPLSGASESGDAQLSPEPASRSDLNSPSEPEG